MSLISVLAEIVSLSATGALSPGPLTFVTISRGSTGGWRSGLMISVGHTLAEAPLVILIFYGLTGVLMTDLVKSAMAIFSGLFLLYLGISELRTKVSPKRDVPQVSGKSSLAVGFVLSAFNPFFILWWFSIGAKMLVDAALVLGRSLLSLAVIYASHVWLDYFWLTFLAHLAHCGKKISEKTWRYIMPILACLLILFAVKFIIEGIYFIVK